MRRLSLALAATTALIPLPAFAGEYALVIEERTINITGKPVKKIIVNGRSRALRSGSRKARRSSSGSPIG
jgi:hypothetical protein